MHKLFLIISVFFCCFNLNPLKAQTESKPLAEWLNQFRTQDAFPQRTLFSPHNKIGALPESLPTATFFELQPENIQNLYHFPAYTLSIPLLDEQQHPVELELALVDILAPGFKLSTDAQDEVPVLPLRHYRGIVKGKPNSVATLSLGPDGVMAMYTDEQGTRQLGPMEDGSGTYILYRAEDFPNIEPRTCLTDDAYDLGGHDDGELNTTDRGVGCKVVQIYFECDYKLYQDKGSNVSTVNTYVTGLFNQIAALYANENVGVAISQIYVWTTPDPYANMTSTSAVLNAFQANRGSNFTGNLAHFLSTRNLGGGIAYVDVICMKAFAFGVSAINTTYQNVPTYSWSVEVVTHELGHNLGSWHTHSCNWAGGALDNCYGTEGGCPQGPAPVNGGTIMSYCHLTSYGINFNNGFGPQPGNLIRDRVLNASCLSQTGTAPGNLSTSNVTANAATLSWNAVSGATNYTVQYKISTASAWTTAGTTTAATYNLSGLSASTAYQWQVKTDCSGYSASASFTTGSSGGGNGSCNPPANLASGSITTTSAVVSWGAVSGATNYTVQYKLASASSWTTVGSTSTTSLMLGNLTAGTNYNWQVKASCSGYSAVQSFTTQSNNGGSCAAPTSLATTNISNSSAVLAWAAVSGATSYTVQYKLSSSSTWTTAGNATTSAYNLGGLTAGSTYNWKVKANCSAYSVAATFSTTGSNGSCAVPSGLSSTVTGATTVSLAWNAVAGASSYQVQIKESNSSVWSVLPATNSTAINVSGLTAATTYNWRVKANCSANSAAQSFTTSNGNNGGSCAAPVNLSNLYVYPTSASISWSPVSGASSYTIQIKLATSSTFTTLGTVSVTAVNLTGLSPSTAYHWRVKANCSLYSAMKYLATPAQFSSTAEPAQLPELQVNGVEEAISIFPNPAQEEINVSFSGILPLNARVRIRDLQGRLMMEAEMPSPQISIECGAWPAGLYLLEIVAEERRLICEKVLKQ